MSFDSLCLDIVERCPNTAVSWYLMAAYAYYELDDPILSDSTFDWLAKTMLESWGTIEHTHKNYITEEDLKAGTLLIKDYPDRAKYAIEQLKKVEVNDERLVSMGGKIQTEDRGGVRSSGSLEEFF